METVHPSLRKQLGLGVKTVKDVQAAADHLADLMIAIHGGAWRIKINHATQFVVVSRDFSDHDSPVDIGEDRSNGQP